MQRANTNFPCSPTAASTSPSIRGASLNSSFQTYQLFQPSQSPQMSAFQSQLNKILPKPYSPQQLKPSTQQPTRQVSSTYQVNSHNPIQHQISSPPARSITPMMAQVSLDESTKLTNMYQFNSSTRHVIPTLGQQQRTVTPLLSHVTQQFMNQPHQVNQPTRSMTPMLVQPTNSTTHVQFNRLTGPFSNNSPQRPQFAQSSYPMSQVNMPSQSAYSMQSQVFQPYATSTTQSTQGVSTQPSQNIQGIQSRPAAQAKPKSPKKPLEVSAWKVVSSRVPVMNITGNIPRVLMVVQEDDDGKVWQTLVEFKIGQVNGSQVWMKRESKVEIDG